MPEGGAEQPFVTVLRGYERRQVDDYVARQRDQTATLRAQLVETQRQRRLATDHAEATEQELAAIPGLGGADAATKIKESAETTMERLRQERIKVAESRTEPLTDREKLLFVRGVGERTLQLLEEAGYKSVEDVLREDEDKLAIKTGLGIKKARAIKHGADQFVSQEWKQIDGLRKAAAQRAREASA